MKASKLFLIPACLSLLLAGVVVLGIQPPATKYHLIKKIVVGGDGGWDALTFDSTARRLYLSHATRVVVIDVESGKIVGEIPNTNGVHGIALAPDLNRGFTSNGRDSTVTVFDMKTLQILSQIKVGKNPDAIIYDPATRRVFCFNGASSDATAIDAQKGTVAGTIALNGKPEFAALDGRGMVYVNLEDKSEVVALDARSLTVKNRWSLAPGEEPSGIALDRKSRRLFAACANQKMIVMNTDNGHIVADLPIGKGVDGADFDPNTKLAFSSNGDGTLTVIHEDSPDKFSVLENATTQRGARTLALDESTHNVFLVTAEFGATPAPTAERPHPRPNIVPGTFSVLVMGTR